LAVCVAAWVASYWWNPMLFSSHSGLMWNFDLQCGGVEVSRVIAQQAVGGTGWRQYHADEEAAEWSYRSSTYRCGGFSYWSRPSPGILSIVRIPLWLPTLLVGGISWFLWRGTRRKNVGGAFPIEVGKVSRG
jgi:hypothetical protein